MKNSNQILVHLSLNIAKVSIKRVNLYSLDAPHKLHLSSRKHKLHSSHTQIKTESIETVFLVLIHFQEIESSFRFHHKIQPIQRDSI